MYEALHTLVLHVTLYAILKPPPPSDLPLIHRVHNYRCKIDNITVFIWTKKVTLQIFKFFEWHYSYSTPQIDCSNRNVCAPICL